MLAGRYPLLVISHGSGGHRFNQHYLAEFLAQHEFIVLAIQHPYNNTEDDSQVGTLQNLWHRPKDVSFIINAILKDTNFSAFIDSTKIGVIGHSLGGFTGFILAGALPNPSLLLKKTGYRCSSFMDFDSHVDLRIKAYFLMAPALCDVFEEDSLMQLEAKMCLLFSSKDELVQYTKKAPFYSRLKNLVSCIEFPEAGHYVYLMECPDAIKTKNDPACFDIGTPREKIHPILRREILSFFEKLMKN